MDIKEIRESGELEQYVLGLLSTEEGAKIEGYLVQYPELKSDIRDIQVALQNYAETYGIKPNAGLEDKIIQDIKQNGGFKKSSSNDISNSISNGSNLWNVISLLLGVLSVATLWYSYDAIESNEVLHSELKSVSAACDSSSVQKDAELNLYRSLLDENTKILDFNPTPKYPNIGLKFYNNNTSKENYIRINRLPEMSQDQAMQLWALRPGSDPVPLDVFLGDDGVILPVTFVEGTQTYAITIEAASGATVPTMERLIATVGV